MASRKRKSEKKPSTKRKPSRNPVGRPSKFTKATRDTILRELRAGSYRNYACLAAGVSYETFSSWLRPPEPTGDATLAAEFLAFSDAVKRAEAEAIGKRLRRIDKAGESHWQADAWFLERRHPDLFGRRTVDVNLRNPAQVRAALADILGVSPEDLPDELGEPDQRP